MGISRKKNIFLQNIFQDGQLKKTEQFPPKFHGLVLGLVGLIDEKGIDVDQSIWS